MRGHLSRFYILPMIMNPSTSSPLKVGVHPRVCCPEYLSPNAICTASDPWCPIYEVSCTAANWTVPDTKIVIKSSNSAFPFYNSYLDFNHLTHSFVVKVMKGYRVLKD